MHCLSRFDLVKVVWIGGHVQDGSVAGWIGKSMGGWMGGWRNVGENTFSFLEVVARKHEDSWLSGFIIQVSHE